MLNVRVTSSKESSGPEHSLTSQAMRYVADSEDTGNATVRSKRS